MGNPLSLLKWEDVSSNRHFWNPVFNNITPRCNTIVAAYYCMILFLLEHIAYAKLSISTISIIIHVCNGLIVHQHVYMFLTDPQTDIIVQILMEIEMMCYLVGGLYYGYDGHLIGFDGSWNEIVCCVIS